MKIIAVSSGVVLETILLLLKEPSLLFAPLLLVLLPGMFTILPEELLPVFNPIQEVEVEEVEELEEEEEEEEEEDERSDLLSGGLNISRISLQYALFEIHPLESWRTHRDP